MRTLFINKACMIEHTFQVLEYCRLLDILSHYASCPLGQSDCLSLDPSNDSEFINNELRLVSEMRVLLKVKGFVSLSDLTDIIPILARARTEGSCLEPDELLCILKLAEASQQANKDLMSERVLCPRMYDLVRDMPFLGPLAKKLKDTISSNGAVKDSASLDLHKIRKKKIQLRSNLQQKLEIIQKSNGLSGDKQGHPMTVRDGRYVIALRADQKQRVQGIIHDYSQSRATCFIEPVTVIQDNNRMSELAQDEKAEEYRILASLTSMVRGLASDLEYCQGLIGRLDGLYARAKFSEALSCVMPEIGEGYGVKLKGAKNPILLALALDTKERDADQDLPVPVDILMDNYQNVLIISGPNRGGKTVTLKTLGLMCLMAQAGIHLPTEEGSCLPVFDQIMADIGDDQDIQIGQSTFSAHAAHLRHFVERADHKSLVIIDEPGMGTDPDEGVALAMSVLDHLSQQGAFVAVSTHLNRLKTYGLLNQRIANASVEFDAERNRPTFKLKYGSPGISRALEIAGNMGVPISILDRAKAYLDQDEVRLNQLIEKMDYLISEADCEKKEAEEAKKTYHSAARKIKERLISLESEKKALMETNRIDAEAAITEARNELKVAINLLKKKKEPVQAYVTERYANVSRKLMDRLEEKNTEKVSAKSSEIKKGRVAYHKKTKQKGVVQSVDLSGRRATVMLGNVKVSVEIQELEVVEEVMKEPGTDQADRSICWDLNGAPQKELNVIGYRIDDAIPLIDKTIDQALVIGEMTLKIIHGFGTGKLREAIRAHLREGPSAKRVCSADPRSGGDAVTIVELN